MHELRTFEPRGSTEAFANNLSAWSRDAAPATLHVIFEIGKQAYQQGGRALVG
jgi:hypothetical protein